VSIVGIVVVGCSDDTNQGRRQTPALYADVGPIFVGASPIILEHRFQIRNSTELPVEISVAERSCGCVKIPPHLEVGALGFAMLPVQVRIDPLHGGPTEEEWRVVLDSTSDEWRGSEVRLRALAVPRFNTEPGPLKFGRPDDNGLRRVRFRAAFAHKANDPIGGIAIECDFSCLRVDILERTEIAKHGYAETGFLSEAVIDNALMPGSAGKRTARVTFVTDSGYRGSALLELPEQAGVQCGVDRVVFIKRSENATTAEVQLWSYETFEVLSVESVDNDVKIENVVSVRKPFGAEASVTLCAVSESNGAGHSTARKSGMLTLHLRHSTQRELVMPYTVVDVRTNRSRK